MPTRGKQDLRLQRGACVHTAVSRVIHKTRARCIFGPGFIKKHVDGRVLAVQKKEKNGKMYTHLHCAFMLKDSVKEATLPLGQVKSGLQNYPERQYDLPEDDPLHQVNLLFEERNSSENGSVEELETSAGISTASVEFPGDRDETRSMEQTEVDIDSSNNATTDPVQRTNEGAEVQRNIGDTGVGDINGSELRPVVEDEPTERPDQCKAHGRDWALNTSKTVVNKPVETIEASFTLATGCVLRRGAAPDNLSLYSVFLSMFPIEYLCRMVSWTNIKLLGRGRKPVKSGELLKVFGVLILISQSKFGSRRELWGLAPPCKFLPKHSFGKIISRVRFEDILSCMSYGPDPNTAVSGRAEVEREKWKCIEPFVEAFNKHRLQYVVPSDQLCIDESISRWYGLGGSWIDVGCPHYVVFDRKPESGMEIQNISCAKTGVLLGLKLVKSANLNDQDNHDSALTAGGRVLVELCKPWSDRPRSANADSYFASVRAAIALEKIGMAFTGVVKNNSKEYPLDFFNKHSLFEKGDWVTLHSSETIKGEKIDIAAICWADRHRRHFITTTGDVGNHLTTVRDRWRQFREGACPIDAGVRMPLAVANYYESAGMIDRHNRVRQDSVDLEKCVGTHKWVFRLGSTIIAMIMTDCRLVYNFGREGRKTLSPRSFYCKLAEELIENDFDERGIHRHMTDYYDVPNDVQDCPLLRPYLQRTEEMVPSGNSKSPLKRKQMKCAGGCGKKTTWVCSLCSPEDGRVYWCNSAEGNKCYEEHILQKHNYG